ncbi:hypothetical protein [Sphingobium yanoikuyae]|uniref:hypothetical protein n=1 Tax=Sphingobium yanoikuyae TaxID=13690 RepID=UPI00030AA3F8|nr:hypothetical protein [Sphingobium yanoikuyae]
MPHRRDGHIARFPDALSQGPCPDRRGRSPWRYPFPEWHAQEGIVHLVFTTRTGLPPLVRAWIDHLAAHFSNGDIFSP